ncbi:surface antigen-domain-containing protein [Phycomyces nitens]|nr:surface antigen-domain-containing protein [Phycomyces nitens]
MESTNSQEEEAFLQQQEAGRRLFQVLSDTAGSNAHVNAVSILGAIRTRPSFLETATAKIMDSKTVADVVNQSQLVADQLMRLDVFEQVKVLLDRASDSDPLAAPGSINVVYQVKEKSRFFIKTGTEIGNNEGNMNGSITVRNVFGGAEVLETVASFGTRNSSSFQFSLAKPVNASPDSRLDINAHHVLQNNVIMSSYEELSRGVGLRYKTLSRFGFHELGYNCVWRSIDKVADTASLSIRNQVGQSLKSSINHTFIRERRDDMLLPTRGHYVRCSQELAGVMGIGNANFAKVDLEAQVHQQFGGGSLLKNKEDEIVGIHPGVVLSLGLRAGWLANLSEDPKAATVSDRFHIGGPLSVRGFKTGGIGPRDYRDALGGDAYWSAGVSLVAPLPKLEEKPLRAQLFVNAGSSVPLKTGANAQDGLHALAESPSISTGFGLIFRHSIARIELNYCIPLTAARGDQIRRGLQLGIGLNFL